MSDPVAKDVEDVLSSIRRLVSDTDAELPQNAAPKPNMRDALILTSALRVKEEDQATSDEDALYDELPPYEIETEDGETLAEALDRIEDELAAEGEAAEQDLEPEEELHTDAAVDDVPNEPVEDSNFFPGGSDLARSDLGSLRQAVSGAFIGEPVMPAVVHTTQNVKQAADASSTLESTTNWGSRAPEDYYEDEELVASDLAAADLSEWKQDETESDAVDEAAALEGTETHVEETHDAFDDNEDVHAFREDAPEEGEDWTDEVELDAAEDAASEEPEEGGAELADLSAADALNEDQADSASAPNAADASGEDISDEYEWDEVREEVEDPVNLATFRHTPVDTAQRVGPLPLVAEVASAVEFETSEEETADTAQVEGKEEPALEASDAEVEASDNKPIDLSDIDETVLDEETLRELVSDIVRKELTGELGERITRNVRKLVRREIHRALATREFD